MWGPTFYFLYALVYIWKERSYDPCLAAWRPGGLRRPEVNATYTTLIGCSDALASYGTAAVQLASRCDYVPSRALGMVPWFNSP
jgi:hypothetical protein